MPQVSSGNINATQWLHEAEEALPGLHYLPVTSLHQAVTSLVEVVCCTSAFYSPLSGSWDTAVQLVQSLLSSNVSHVRAAACKALAGAVCIGPVASQCSAAGVVCHKLVLQELIGTALAADDSKQTAAQALQVQNGCNITMACAAHVCKHNFCSMCTNMWARPDAGLYHTSSYPVCVADKYAAKLKPTVMTAAMPISCCKGT